MESGNSKGGGVGWLGAFHSEFFAPTMAQCTCFQTRHNCACRENEPSVTKNSNHGHLAISTSYTRGKKQTSLSCSAHLLLQPPVLVPLCTQCAGALVRLSFNYFTTLTGTKFSDVSHGTHPQGPMGFVVQSNFRPSKVCFSISNTQHSSPYCSTASATAYPSASSTSHSTPPACHSLISHPSPITFAPSTVAILALPDLACLDLTPPAPSPAILIPTPSSTLKHVHAHDVVINIRQFDHRSSAGSGPRQLFKFSMPITCHDSSVRHPTPKCHLGTRNEDVDFIADWVLRVGSQGSLSGCASPFRIGKASRAALRPWRLEANSQPPLLSPTYRPLTRIRPLALLPSFI